MGQTRVLSSVFCRNGAVARGPGYRGAGFWRILGQACWGQARAPWGQRSVLAASPWRGAAAAPDLLSPWPPAQQPRCPGCSHVPGPRPPLAAPWAGRAEPACRAAPPPRVWHRGCPEPPTAGLAGLTGVSCSSDDGKARPCVPGPCPRPAAGRHGGATRARWVTRGAGPALLGQGRRCAAPGPAPQPSDTDRGRGVCPPRAVPSEGRQAAARGAWPPTFACPGSRCGRSCLRAHGLRPRLLSQGSHAGERGAGSALG